ncbi:hypothetical protein D3C87_741340 [compost metagenome]
MFELIVQGLRLQAEQAAQARLGDVPIMRKRAEGEHIGEEAFAVVFVILFDFTGCAGLAGGDRSGFFPLQFIVQAAHNTGGKQHQPGSRCREYDTQYRGDRAGGVSADKKGGKTQDHVTDDTADAVRKRPGDGGRKTAERGGADNGASDPGHEADGYAVEFTTGDQRDRPGDDREKRDDCGKPEELHHDIGENRTTVTQKIGRLVSCRIGEARIRHIPCGECGNAQRDRGQHSETGQSHDLTHEKRRQHEACVTTIECRRMHSAHVPEPVAFLGFGKIRLVTKSRIDREN